MNPRRPGETIKFWNPATGRAMDLLPRGAVTVAAFGFSPDGKTFAAGLLQRGKTAIWLWGLSPKGK